MPQAMAPKEHFAEDGARTMGCALAGRWCPRGYNPGRRTAALAQRIAGEELGPNPRLTTFQCEKDAENQSASDLMPIERR